MINKFINSFILIITMGCLVPSSSFAAAINPLNWQMITPWANTGRDVKETIGDKQAIAIFLYYDNSEFRGLQEDPSIVLSRQFNLEREPGQSQADFRSQLDGADTSVRQYFLDQSEDLFRVSVPVVRVNLGDHTYFDGNGFGDNYDKLVGRTVSGDRLDGVFDKIYLQSTIDVRQFDLVYLIWWNRLQGDVNGETAGFYPKGDQGLRRYSWAPNLPGSSSGEVRACNFFKNVTEARMTGMRELCMAAANALVFMPVLYDNEGIIGGTRSDITGFCLMSGVRMNEEDTPKEITRRDHPPSINPYFKEKAGWATVRDIDPATRKRLCVLRDRNYFYRFKNPRSESYSFYFESRNNSGVEAGTISGRGVEGETPRPGPDTAAPSEGLVLHHIATNGDNRTNLPYSLVAPGPYEVSIVDSTYSIRRTHGWDALNFRSGPEPSSEAALRGDKYVLTDAGTGDFDLVDGVFVPSENGDYILDEERYKDFFNVEVRPGIQEPIALFYNNEGRNDQDLPSAFDRPYDYWPWISNVSPLSPAMTFVSGVNNDGNQAIDLGPNSRYYPTMGFQDDETDAKRTVFNITADYMSGVDPIEIPLWNAGGGTLTYEIEFKDDFKLNPDNQLNFATLEGNRSGSLTGSDVDLLTFSFRTQVRPGSPDTPNNYLKPGVYKAIATVKNTTQNGNPDSRDRLEILINLTVRSRAVIDLEEASAVLVQNPDSDAVEVKYEARVRGAVDAWRKDPTVLSFKVRNTGESSGRFRVEPAPGVEWLNVGLFNEYTIPGKSEIFVGLTIRPQELATLPMDDGAPTRSRNYGGADNDGVHVLIQNLSKGQYESEKTLELRVDFALRGFQLTVPPEFQFGTLDSQGVSDELITDLVFSGNAIAMTWGPVPYIDGYEIYRTTTKAGGVNPLTDGLKVYELTSDAGGGLNNREFTDTTAEIEQPYYYWIRAFSKGVRNVENHYSQFSLPIRAILRKPGPPRNVKATDGEFENFIRITWQSLPFLKPNQQRLAVPLDREFEVGSEFDGFNGNLFFLDPFYVGAEVKSRGGSGTSRVIGIERVAQGTHPFPGRDLTVIDPEEEDDEWDYYLVIDKPFTGFPYTYRIFNNEYGLRGLDFKRVETTGNVTVTTVDTWAEQDFYIENSQLQNVAGLDQFQIIRGSSKIPTDGEILDLKSENYEIIEGVEVESFAGLEYVINKFQYDDYDVETGEAYFYFVRQIYGDGTFSDYSLPDRGNVKAIGDDMFVPVVDDKFDTDNIRWNLSANAGVGTSADGNSFLSLIYNSGLRAPGSNVDYTEYAEQTVTMPNGDCQLVFDYCFNERGRDEWFMVYINEKVVFSVKSNSAAYETFETVGPLDLNEFAGQEVTLRFEYTAALDGTSSPSQGIKVDNVKMNGANFEPMWQLVSTPYRQLTANKLFKRPPFAGTAVRIWNGEEYVVLKDTDFLQPLQGYWILSDQLVSDEDFSNSGSTSTSFSLSSGWNVIGVPAVTKLKQDARFNGCTVYSWDPLKTRYVEVIDELVPHRGYWVFKP